MCRKINFAKYLKIQKSDALAHQIFEEQERLNLPGLSKECQEIAKDLNIIDELNSEDIKMQTFKNITRRKINIENENSIRKKIQNYSKMDETKEEIFEQKEYLKKLNLKEIRTQFRIRTRMLDFKFNFKNKNAYAEQNWMCDSCEKAVETQSHVLWCPAYQSLRQDKNLNSEKDLIDYFLKVLDIRTELNLTK